MDHQSTRSNPGEWTVETGIDEYRTSIESGNYRKTVKTSLSKWIDWLSSEYDITYLSEIDVMHCRRYARHLKSLCRGNQLKSSTAHTYYSVLRAFLGFAVNEEQIGDNPAAVKRAVDQLPKDSGDRERQFWSKEQRKQLCRYADKQARESLEHETKADQVSAFRNRALIYVLSLSGVRSGEILKDPNDSQRNGVSWKDIDLENGTAKVLGKTRSYEYAQLPTESTEALKRLKQVLDPESRNWPVFPSNHSPSEYRVFREQTGREPPEELDIDTAIREHDVTPPALSKNGARNILENMCREARITNNGEVLKLHGARRGLGHELYRKGHAELAQTALRHSSIEVTHQAYSDIKASETADRVDDVLDN